MRQNLAPMLFDEPDPAARDAQRTLKDGWSLGIARYRAKIAGAIPILFSLYLGLVAGGTGRALGGNATRGRPSPT
jgi:hypothetical protein